MTEPPTFPRGTAPEGASSELDASRKVREMFTRIAPRYDLLNHLLSAQMDRVWRNRTARELKPILDRGDAIALDLCCGTGDLSLALQQRARARIIGADFSHTMLVRARQKASQGNGVPRVEFFEADALSLPFADSSFDLVTTAFGFRNLANYEAGLREIARVLKSRGALAILDFSEPAPGILGDVYRFYFRKVLPKVGGIISGDPEAYAYLPRSVSRFFRPDELAALMKQVGYTQVHYHLMTLNSVALHLGVRE